MRVTTVLPNLILLCIVTLCSGAAGPFDNTPPAEFNKQMSALAAEPGGFPSAWYAVRPASKANATVVEEDGQRFLRVSGQQTSIGSVVKAPKEGVIPTTIVTFKARLVGYEKSPNGSPPNLSAEFLDSGGGISATASVWIADEKEMDGWFDVRATLTSRRDDRIRFLLNFDAKTGHLDISNFQVAFEEEKVDRSKIHSLDDTDPMFGRSEERRVTDPSRITGAKLDESKVTRTLYVDPAAENANDLNPGTDSRKPKRTIAGAVAEAQQVYNEWRSPVGIRISLAAGVHRVTQPISVDQWRYWARNVPLILEGDPNGGTIIAGSVTEGFESNTWELVDKERKVYRHAWDHNWGLVDRGYYTSPNILTHRRELVALGGKLLKPRILEAYDYVDSRGRQYNEAALLIAEGRPSGKPGYTYRGFLGIDKLEPGEFGVAELGPDEPNYAGFEHDRPNSIFIRLPDDVTSLDKVLVEVGIAPSLLRAYDHHQLVLRNLTFKHAAGWYLNYADETAVEIQYDPNMFSASVSQDLMPKNVIVEQCKFIDNNGRGLAVTSNGFTIRNCDFINNGRDGMSVEGRNGIIENVLATRNNRIGFLAGNKATPHGGGGISLGAMDLLFKNVKSNENHGTGLRGDVIATNIIFDTCEFNRNLSQGQMQEISWGPILYKNTQVMDNGTDGLLFYNVWDITLENSIIAGNKRRQLTFANDTGRSTAVTWAAFVSRDAGGARTEEQKKRDADLGRIPTCRNLTIRNSTIAAPEGAEPQLVAYHTANVEAYRDFIRTEVTADNNRYWASEPNAFNVNGGWDRAAFVDFETWKKTTGQDVNSLWEKPQPGRDEP